MAKIAETPLMLQYLEMKKKHPDAILLFRVGDFYETFSDDAIAASEILGITLTRRANGKAQSVELAGFPHHALDSYLPKLVRAGRRVAICEQLEDPKLTKKLVKRGITELVTPGVNTSTGALQAKENNFLAAVHIGKNSVGLAFLDISTGEFLCSETTAEEADKLLCNMSPKELLRMRGTRDFCMRNFSHKCSVFELEDWVYTTDAAEERLLRQFSTATLKGFGVGDLPLGVIAAGSILHYLDLTSHTQLSHITSLSRIDNRLYMHLDRFTVRNLELVESMGPEGKSLLKVIDKTVCPMGSRLLYRWLILPLLDISRLNKRHDAVEAFFSNNELRDQARDAVRRTGDMERLGGRVASGKISPREMIQLSEGVRGAMTLKDILRGSGIPVLEDIGVGMTDIIDVADWISATISGDAPTSFGKAPVIAPGVDPELDELRGLHANSRSKLQEIQAREMEATGISSLKVAYNNVFGYYLEVRNTHKDKVPEYWIRKQTLVNAERYITPELKEYEEKIAGAEERIAAIEDRIYKGLLSKINTRFTDLHVNASAVAQTDCLLSFAEAAAEYGYVRPEIDDSLSLSIMEGRHPVIERNMTPGESYVSNSVTLDSDSCQIIMITGPNMSGKSALLRQTALIALMAQIGSFVPAKAARIGIVDKIFTRVGASDNISSGESTFMVEMNEAASILNNMSNRSLILFDELGRGTSTYDGISIAWSIVEHIHDNGRCRPKTLFATHYHELNEMENKFERISNYNVSVKEIGGKVVFLRKLEKGGSEHSFGIHVAKLAGMPPAIVKRANQVLAHLEEASKGVNGDKDSIAVKGAVSGIDSRNDGYQMSFFQLDDPLLSQIRDRLLGVDVNTLTPLQALNMLNDLQGLLTGK
ncbi:DNA mismatch repair protein MutS [Lepagella muris]|jgi:DNA mismatch repair protein MutS|uniref:DNA mismatch repair protein MutS n=1 Tax=Lepagella muris TaxID=3032870 RepID=A0AC61RC26_9BACT|nr:DNA mismatch repair protein MutS [Lepagella muris]ROT02405.1 DNA mismatch repair protein MutS [Muribaculaceae bacterium Isolate-037 (Harlan)]TGY76805.1 DNA mismatch repair protein MutS [Lepagella muris]THG47921.1 DNA mismatch repair protein MutS [Bacteroidales bacterium]TKC54566.1 DNA mismatch repair protein MutS [Bacteroidales bacterium]